MRFLVLLALPMLLFLQSASSLASSGIVASVSDADLAVLHLQREAVQDTCSGEWILPFYTLWEWAQENCEASRCDVGPQHMITAVHVVWANYGEQHSEKPVEIIIWADEGGFPGEVLWSIETTTTLLEPGETRMVQYDVEPQLYGIPVWFGHRELVPGPPSSLFDESAEAEHVFASPPCGNWSIQDLGDYLQMLEHGTGSTAVAGHSVAGRMPLSIERVAVPTPGMFRITIHVREDIRASLRVFDPSGGLVGEVSPGKTFGQGRHCVTWASGAVPSGAYLLALQSPSAAQTRKVIVLH